MTSKAEKKKRRKERKKEEALRQEEELKAMIAPIRRAEKRAKVQEKIDTEKDMETKRQLVRTAGRFPASHCLEVFDLPSTTWEKEVIIMFQPFGMVVLAKIRIKGQAILRHAATRRKTFWLVIFSMAWEAEAAWREMDEAFQQGRVTFTVKRSDKEHMPLWTPGQWQLYLSDELQEVQEVPGGQDSRGEEALSLVQRIEVEMEKEVETKKSLVEEEAGTKDRVEEVVETGVGEIKRQQVQEKIENIKTLVRGWAEERETKKQLEAYEQLEEEKVMRSGVFPPSHGLALFHLQPSTSEAGLVEMFQEFGTLVGVLVLQGSSGKPFAFVFFSTAEEAEVARGEMARRAPWAPFTCARPHKPYTPKGQWAFKWLKHLHWCDQQKLRNQSFKPHQHQHRHEKN